MITEVKDKECNVVIVDKCKLMRNTLKSMILNHNYEVHEASDDIGALNLAMIHRPKIVFISMEDNQYWPGLVQSLKDNNSDCTVVAYSTEITRDTVASAYFAGVDDILVNPENQKERMEKFLSKEEGVNPYRYYSFPSQVPSGFNFFKKFYCLQAE